MTDYVERYKGFYIYSIKTKYVVEQYDTILYRGTLDECRRFCDDFTKAMTGKKG